MNNYISVYFIDLIFSKHDLYIPFVYLSPNKYINMIFQASKLILLLLFFTISYAQVDTVSIKSDSTNAVALQDYNRKLQEIEQQRIVDSIRKAELESQLIKLKTTDNIQKEELLKQLQTIEENEQERITGKKARINALRDVAKGYPVIGVSRDTLFLVYSKIGASTPKDRAGNITRKIKNLYENDFLRTDSIIVVKSENTYDIIYEETIIMSVSEDDAIWYDQTMLELAESFNIYYQRVNH